MATSGPGTPPLSHVLQSPRALRPAPEQKPDPKTAFDRLSRETNVPANVLIALDEAEGDEKLARGRHNAGFLGRQLAGGAKIEAAVAELVSDNDRGPCLMSRSYEIADDLYPEQGRPRRSPTRHRSERAWQAEGRQRDQYHRWRAEMPWRRCR